jgi:adenosylhomocysteine nucleosidase
MMHTLFLAAIGIMSAMPQEADSFHNAMTEKSTVSVGNKTFIQGKFEGIPVVFCLAGIGKVSAATTATLLTEKFGVEKIIFTGVAGGGDATHIGDIVIGSSYLQHDLDLRPIYPQFYIYSLDKQLLHADLTLISDMKESARRFLQTGIRFPHLGVTNPQVHEGIIVSGDRFIGSSGGLEHVVEQTKEILPSGFHAIEMEGAAVAQVCLELNVPFVVLRAISDKANEKASVDFLTFIEEVATAYSLGILKEYFRSLQKENSSYSK